MKGTATLTLGVGGPGMLDEEKIAEYHIEVLQRIEHAPDEETTLYPAISSKEFRAFPKKEPKNMDAR